MILDGGCQVDAAAVVKQRGFHIRVSVQPGLVVGHAIIQIRGQIIDHAVVAQGAQVLGVEAHIHDIGVVAGTKHQGHLIGFAALGRNLPVDFDVEHILPVMDHCAVTIVLFGIGHVVALLERGVGQLLVVVSQCSSLYKDQQHDGSQEHGNDFSHGNLLIIQRDVFTL